MGAAGRDFHNFNIYFKDNPKYKVVCFTAMQIPNIDKRKYPKELAGKLYPLGIPIYSESDLPNLIKKYDVDLVVLSYSDLSYDDVMHKASLVLSLGPDFEMLGPKATMYKSKVPLISVCAVRTGCGKSETTRYVAKILKESGKKVVVIRHPMPYGNLKEQRVQRFASLEDLDKNKCTIEEREEYEQHIKDGNIVYAGVDYYEILKEAEKEAEIIIWDGGNNDFPFYYSDLKIVVADPHRAGHEVKYYPGEVNFRMADIIVINKVKTATPENIEIIRNNIDRLNPNAEVIEAESKISLSEKVNLKGKRVLVIEDGPTLTHGGMKFGAGFIAAKERGAHIINPNLYAKGQIKEVLEKFELENIVPAMGYSREEINDLERTINASACDYVIDGSPVNLKNILNVNKPIIQVKYDLQVVVGNLKKLLLNWLNTLD